MWYLFNEDHKYVKKMNKTQCNKTYSVRGTLYTIYNVHCTIYNVPLRTCYKLHTIEIHYLSRYCVFSATLSPTAGT